MEEMWSKLIQSKTKTKKSLPLRTKYDEESRLKRLQFLEDQTKLSFSEFKKMRNTPSEYRGNIESLIGTIEIPVGIAGPLNVTGDGESGELYAPIATTEGALVSSINRGCRALSLSGGVRAHVLKKLMVRAPMFDCGDLDTAIKLKNWIHSHRGEIKKKVRNFSSHAELVDIKLRLIGANLHARFEFTTGDASGQNMTTVCVWNVCHWISERFAITKSGKKLEFKIEGNFSSDKKNSAISAADGRGVEVVAEATIPGNVLRRVLHTSAADLALTIQRAKATSVLTGLNGFNINIANALAGIFTATGQDIASVHESSSGELVAECRGEDLYLSLVLPNLVIGTVGGGTGLPGQKQMLQLLGGYGSGRSTRFAEGICAFALALELSTGAAITGGQFVSAHERLGRNRKKTELSEKDFSPVFFNHFMDDLTDEAGPILEVRAMSLMGVGKSLVMDLTSRVSRRMCGLKGYELVCEKVDAPIKSFLKVKATDKDVILATEIMAGTISPGLGELLYENRKNSLFTNSHLREIRLAQRAESELKSICPVTYGTYINEKRSSYIIAQEYLEDLELFNVVEQRERWKLEHLKAAIRDISQVHGKFLNNYDCLESEDWMFTLTPEKISELYECHYEMIRNLNTVNYDWFKDSDFHFLLEKLDESRDSWKQFNALPKTLIHNDFNPRNLAFRRNPNELNLVAYDWELATILPPQRDFAELMAFGLSEDLDWENFDTLAIYHHECVQAKSGISLDLQSWKKGVYWGMLDVLLHRLPMYSIAQSVKRLDFLKPTFLKAIELVRRMEKEGY